MAKDLTEARIAPHQYTVPAGCQKAMVDSRSYIPFSFYIADITEIGDLSRLLLWGLVVDHRLHSQVVKASDSTGEARTSKLCTVTPLTLRYAWESVIELVGPVLVYCD